MARIGDAAPARGRHDAQDGRVPAAERVAGEGAGVDEKVLRSEAGVHRWDGPKARVTVAGTARGTLLVTDRHLVFLAQSGGGLGRRVRSSDLGSSPVPPAPPIAPIMRVKPVTDRRSGGTGRSTSAPWATRPASRCPSTTSTRRGRPAASTAPPTWRCASVTSTARATSSR